MFIGKGKRYFMFISKLAKEKGISCLLAKEKGISCLLGKE